jgi:anti-anti-sigma factor
MTSALEIAMTDAFPTRDRETQSLWQAGLHGRYCRARWHDGVAIITVTAAQLLDDVVADGFLEELLTAAAQAEARNVVVDLRHVSVAGNAAFAGFASLNAQVRRHGGRLVICGACPAVEELFHVEELAEGTSRSGLSLVADTEAALETLVDA